MTPLAISATAVRELVARGGDPRYLVPEPVRAIIAGSGCYAGRDGESVSREA